MTEQSQPLEDFLPYELPYLTEELEEKARLELFENEETRTHALEQLRSMLKGETFQWKDEEIFLLAFLRSKKFDVESAFNTIKSFYATINKFTDLFCDFEYSDIERTLSENIMGFLPFRDKDGCIILVSKIENWNPPGTSIGHIYRGFLASLLHALLSPSTQVAGIKLIVDNKGFPLSKLIHLKPEYIHLIAKSIQHIFPTRIQGFYNVNDNAVIQVVWNVVKRLLPKKLTKRFHFLGKDFEELHQHISPKILPKEYGGDLLIVDNSDWVKKVAEKSDYLMSILCASKTKDCNPDFKD